MRALFVWCQCYVLFQLFVAVSAGMCLGLLVLLPVKLRQSFGGSTQQLIRCHARD